MTRGNSIDCPITQDGTYSTLNEEPYTPVSETYSFEEVDSGGQSDSQPVVEIQEIQGVELENGPCRCSYPLCRWTTYDGDHFRAHLESHRSGRRFECYVDECGSLFDYTEDLCTHTTSYHSHSSPTKLSYAPTTDYDNTRPQFLSTPDHTPNLSNGLFPVYPSSAPMSIARTLSYGAGATPHAPLLARSLTYNGAKSAPPVMTEFVIPPHTQPHRLASPLGFADRPSGAGSRRGPLPNIKVESPYIKSQSHASTRQSRYDHSPRSHPPVTPISPAHHIPLSYSVLNQYSHHISNPSTPQRHRHSPYSSPEVTPRTYASAQAALVSATSLNRMLARLTPDVSPEPADLPAPTKRTKRKRKSNQEDDYDSDDSSTSSNYEEEKPAPATKAVSRSKASRMEDVDEKPHLCDYPGCGQRFKRAEHKKRHYKIHAKEKPFGCDISGCGRFFSYVSFFSSIRCAVIDFVVDFFRRSDNLTQHKRTHLRGGRNSYR